MAFVPDILLQNNPDGAIVRTKHWRSSSRSTTFTRIARFAPRRDHIRFPETLPASSVHPLTLLPAQMERVLLPYTHAAKRGVHETALRKTRQRHSDPRSV